MRKQFTAEDYMFVETLIEESIKMLDTVRLKKLQLLRSKISSNILFDGNYEDLQLKLDKAIMTRV